jgi:hypothetical protein
MNRVTSFVLLALSAVAVPGCDVEEPPPGPTFARVNEEILKPNCTFACHSGGDNAAGGLDLSVDPYSVLVGAAPTALACEGVAMKRVAPGDPMTSLVYVKVLAKQENVEPICGDVMPPAPEPALTQAQLDLVRAWIAAGAPND